MPCHISYFTSTFLPPSVPYDPAIHHSPSSFSFNILKFIALRAFTSPSAAISPFAFDQRTDLSMTREVPRSPLIPRQLRGAWGSQRSDGGASAVTME